MEFKAKNVATTFRNENIDGIHFSVFKSAMQKFIRRDEHSMGLGTMMMLKNFDTPDGAKLVSNIINRNIIIMSEEVGINEPMLPVVFRNMHEKFIKSRDYQIVIDMYLLLCKSKKCRLVSDVKTFYLLSPYSKIQEKIHKKMILDEDPFLMNIHTLDLETDELIVKIREQLLEKSYNTFVYLSLYLKKKHWNGKREEKFMECSV